MIAFFIVVIFIILRLQKYVQFSLWRLPEFRGMLPRFWVMMLVIYKHIDCEKKKNSVLKKSLFFTTLFSLLFFTNFALTTKEKCIADTLFLT